MVDTGFDRRRVALGATFHQHFENTPEALFRKRLLCVYLIYEGHPAAHVADWLGVNPRTVRRWKACYDQAGIKGLKEKSTGGRPQRLDRCQIREITQDLRRIPADLGLAGTQWKGPLLQRHLLQRFGLSIGLRQCQRLLQRVQGGERDHSGASGAD